LEAAHLSEAVSIISEKCPNALIKDEESVEINFDAIDTKTYKELTKHYVKIQKKKERKLKKETNTSISDSSSSLLLVSSTSPTTLSDVVGIEPIVL